MVIVGLFFMTVHVFGQTNDFILVNPETPPSFPGGFDSLKVFISRNLRYPPTRIDIEQKVFVQFVVNEDGSLSDTKIIKGLCEPCNKNALELFSKMPNWIPGKRFDKTIKTTMVLPIKFGSSK